MANANVRKKHNCRPQFTREADAMRAATVLEPGESSTLRCVSYENPRTDQAGAHETPESHESNANENAFVSRRRGPPVARGRLFSPCFSALGKARLRAAPLFRLAFAAELRFFFPTL